MAWQDRDWAKLDDSEREAIYGVPRPPGPLDRKRAVAWTAVTILTVAVSALAIAAHRRAPPAASLAVAPQPSVIHGIRGTEDTADFAPGGRNTVCTEEAIDPRSGQWACVAWLLNENDLPVLAPPIYRGQCGHVLADQTTGAWTCLSRAPPAAPSVPPPPAISPSPSI
jgi:hypothetical protein